MNRGIDKEELLPDGMKRIFIVLIGVLLFPSINALPHTEIESQGVFGGYSVTVSSNYTNSSAGGLIMDSPAIVEVYTATWCDNCVDSEHALIELLSERNENVQVMYHHRYIGEIEDPFGSQNGDERVLERYGAILPPTVVFHGDQVKSGSVADDCDGCDGTLKSEYGFLLDKKPTSYSGWTSEFSWSGNNSSGILNWSLEPQGEEFNSEIVITTRLLVVEQSAYFPEGSNGLDNYDHAVRAVFTLNGVLGGEDQLDLPQSWDGDDLSLVLIHDWREINEETITAEPSEDSGLLGLPSLGLFWVVVSLLSVAMCKKKY